MKTNATAKVHNFEGISNKGNVFSNKLRNFAEQKSFICLLLLVQTKKTKKTSVL